MQISKDLIPLLVVPQHPDTTEPVGVHVPGPLLTGPVGNRLAVFDYNRDTDTVLEGVPRRDDGGFDRGVDTASVHFQQLNAYAIAARAISFVERELGRTLSWGFDGGRLFMLPHAGEMANAFYSKETKSLLFFSYFLDNQPSHTCLIHDIVAHEVGHALLDAVRDRYTAGLHPETAAIHEGFGDLTALFAALSHDTVRNSMLDDEGNRLRDDNEVATIAERFHRGGGGMTRRAALRDLAKSVNRDFSGVTEPHDLSLKLTTGLYQAFQRLFTINRERGDDGTTALAMAHRALQRMVVRGLDYLPPADGDFEDFARAVLQADRWANPSDDRGYRRAVAESFAARGIGNSADDLLESSSGSESWLKPTGQWPPRTKTDAYLFLDGHRESLALGKHPEYRDFVVHDFQVTRAPEERAHGAADANRDAYETVVIVYEYPEDVLLQGGRFGSLEGRWVTLWGGGTLVFDTDARVVYHAKKPVRDDRVAATLDHLSVRISNRDLAVQDGASGVPGLLSVGKPFVVSVDGEELLFKTNLAAGCGRRMPEIGRFA